ncbi:hypothetical protein PFAG_02613 [Plasmodium falciparum Santa Lucia]|uniref:UBX domain-containing protein n=3 Tax=Plasmodium falciparum TaxID=5833 RepID=A0A024W7R0_PLAFA|nr:hypothetical protein PFTANZ_02688 [Plasmodium falciparum Tanzania (2000708)]ETW61523.1 hypothetical protein PFMC_02614 [Plasmodium falciparum CAMP/Malaysia]EUT86154.1 hypothetical protein PFAG_02613 [Plasmodium falciparum Santa Lucia]
MNEFIKLFMDITKEDDEKKASSFLESYNWNVEEAITRYFIATKQKTSTEDVTTSNENNENNQVLEKKNKKKEKKNKKKEKKNKKKEKNKKEESNKKEEKNNIHINDAAIRNEYLHKNDEDNKDISDFSSISSDEGNIEEGNTLNNYEINEEEHVGRTNFLYFLNHIGKMVFPIFKNLYNVMSSFFKILSTYIISSTTTSTAASASESPSTSTSTSTSTSPSSSEPYTSSYDNGFTKYYENKYSKVHTDFFRGSLKEAINKSRREEKLLLVYLHIEYDDVSYFCEHVFNNLEMKSFFDENCILYAHDISKGDIKELSTTLNVFMLPQISIILTCYVTDMMELSIIYGQPSITHIMNTISHCIEKMDMKREKMEMLKNKNYRDRLIREEQDREYQEALRKDRLKEEEKKKKENEKLVKIQEKNKIKNERKEKTKKFPLCISSNEQIAKICIRLPNGIRIQNNFGLSNTLQDIYEWAECSEFLQPQNQKVIIPYKFQLICSLTKWNVQRTSEQIKNFDLYPNAIFNMKSLDTSDEE